MIKTWNTILLQMAVLKSNHPRVLASILLAVLVGDLGLVLRNGLLGDGLIQISYDSLHRLSKQPALTNSPVVIVYLDLPSYLQLAHNPAQPWPRKLHAQLLRRLSADEVHAVVFDVVFSGPGTDATADEALAASIRESGRVVLAAEYNNDASHVMDATQPWTRTHSVVRPHEPFVRASVGSG